MILAAGRGERMRPLTDLVPKPLLEVLGKPLIQYHLENLSRAGVERVVINHSWLGDQIVERLGSGQKYNLDIVYSAEPEALETAGGILKALPLLCPDAATKVFWVINGDVFSDFDFALLPHELGADQAHLVMVDNPQHNPNGDFALHNHRLNFGPADKLTFSGIAAYQASFFKGMNAGKQALAPVFRTCIENKCLSGQKHNGFWSDVGTPARLKHLNENGVTG